MKTLSKMIFLITLFSLTSVFVSNAQKILNINGKVTMLRVHDVGTQYGDPANAIDAEVIFRISSKPDLGLGFTLRNDTNLYAHQGMFTLLQEAYKNGWTIYVDYKDTGKKNCIAFRVWTGK